MLILVPIKINMCLHAKIFENQTWCVEVKCALGEKNKVDYHMVTTATLCL